MSLRFLGFAYPCTQNYALPLLPPIVMSKYVKTSAMAEQLIASSRNPTRSQRLHLAVGRALTLFQFKRHQRIEWSCKVPGRFFSYP